MNEVNLEQRKQIALLTEEGLVILDDPFKEAVKDLNATIGYGKSVTYTNAAGIILGRSKSFGDGLVRNSLYSEMKLGFTRVYTGKIHSKVEYRGFHAWFIDAEGVYGVDDNGDIVCRYIGDIAYAFDTRTKHVHVKTA